MAFSIFTEWCIHYHNQFKNNSIILKEILLPFQSHIQCSPHQPRETTVYTLSPEIYFSEHMELEPFWDSLFQFA